MVTLIRKSLKFLLPVVVLGVAIMLARIIDANKPEPLVSDTPVSVASVDATRLVATQYPIVLRSQGTVRPTLANTLVPAVAGTVISIDPAFVVGGTFDSGDVLLQIDARDYQIALTQATANLAQSQAQLQEQLALAEQAQLEWNSLGRSGQPSALTLREPQLAAARASLEAAEAQVEQAELDLERTRVIAPYRGMVSERLVDLGQFVARGAPVGTIHSLEAVDVRLALNSGQLAFIDLPDSSFGAGTTTPTRVELTAAIGNNVRRWAGTLVRVEGIDASTRQLNVIARVQAPFTQSDTPLRVGQFVQADIEGSVLEDVYVIPRAALREDREVLIVNEQDLIQRRSVRVVWSDDDEAVIDEGLDEGEMLVLTPLGAVSDGTPVRATVDGIAPVATDS